jgi:hypothetical protein
MWSGVGGPYRLRGWCRQSEQRKIRLRLRRTRMRRRRAKDVRSIHDSVGTDPLLFPACSALMSGRGLLGEEAELVCEVFLNEPTDV